MSNPGISPPHPIPDDKKATEHLANERTFLAWVRTSIALVSLGFVVAKFGLWLDEMSRMSPDRAVSAGHVHRLGWSLPLGAGMMGMGAALTLLAAWHHRRTTRDIEAGRVFPATWLVSFVSGAVALLAAGMVAYLLLSARQR